jgi:UDPglucose 6-dehydrogenase
MEKVAVIGIGRLGLCFALNLEHAGYAVLGVDVDENYLDLIDSKKFKSNEPELEWYLERAKNIEVSTSVEKIATEKIQYIFILVATPSQNDGSFDHSQIDQVAEVLSNLPKDDVQRHIVVGATTMPGYCDMLAERLGESFSVTYNPEFIAQGSIIKDQQNPDQILIGEGHIDATEKLKEIYAKMCKSLPSIHIMNRKSAEICKLATNCYLTMKISYANAIGDLALLSGGEPEKILAAIGADSRISPKYLKYGFGYGGPCFPRDNRALAKHGSDNGFSLFLSEATDKVNNTHLDFQFENFLSQEGDIIFDYVTYKSDTDILDESQQLKLALRLARAGKRVVVKNHGMVTEKLRQLYGDLLHLE